MENELITGPLRHLRKPFESNIKPDQNVLVVTDTAQDTRVWQAALTIIADLKAEATLAMYEPRPADHYDPPPAVASAMMESDVNVLMTTTSLGHSAVGLQAMGAGIPTIQIDGHLTLEMFQKGAATADYWEIMRMKHFCALNVFGSNAQEARVTSDYGTDLTYGIEGRVFVPPLRPADWDPFKAFKRTEEGRTGSPRYLVLFPGGEFNVPPLEGTGNGKLVVDLTMHHLGRLNDPIELFVRDGRIFDIRGGTDAKRLRDHLDTYGDENAYMFPTEASVGLNRNATIIGEQREDKNILGAMHFGLGTNSDVGGSVTSKLHMDAVVLQPTLFVDGDKRIEGGRFLVPLDR